MKFSIKAGAKFWCYSGEPCDGNTAHTATACTLRDVIYDDFDLLPEPQAQGHSWSWYMVFKLPTKVTYQDQLVDHIMFMKESVEVLYNNGERLVKQA